MKDLDTLKSVCDSIAGRTLCAFGDAAITPVLSSMAKFREEYEYYITHHESWTAKGETFAAAVGRS
jgi:NADH-quinone oxidoreductase subunit F